MSETDLQLGGGYTYQWECAILLALNYFFEPVRYNPTLFDLVKDFLGRVAEIHLEGEDRESGIDLEDINLINGDRRILIQVKTKQAEGKPWTPTAPLLLKALYRFYDSRFFADQPDDTRFVFLTNRPFNRTLARVKDAIREGTLDECPEADALCRALDRHARKEKQAEAIDPARFRELLARTALVEYLAVDEVKANIQAKLQARGRPDWGRAYAALFEDFTCRSTRRGGGTVTIESVTEVLGPLPEPTLRDKELAYLDGLLKRYEHWRVHYTPLAGIAEVRAAVEDGPRLDLPMPFVPREFEKLEEHGFGARAEVRREPVDDLRAAVAEHRRILLLGDPGSGKTTTLWRLAYDYADAARAGGRAPLPLLVPLGGYTDDGPFDAYLARHLGPLAPYLETYRASERLILLLDGLNEMPQAEYAGRVGRIQDVLDRYPDEAVVVTCRALDYVVEVEGLQKVEVLPLDETRIRTFLHNYLGRAAGERLFWVLAGGKDVRALWDTWQRAGGTWTEFWTARKMPENVYAKTSVSQDNLWARLRREPPPLLALGRNPYLLLMTAQVYARAGGALPANRARLFAAFVDTLLGREEERHPQGWVGAERQKDGLAALAYAMRAERGRGTTVERGWAVDCLCRAVPGCDAGRLLYLATSAMLLDADDETVRFYHQLLQEYFAAREMGRRVAAGEPLDRYWPLDRWWEPSGWEETAVLLAGMKPDASMLLEGLAIVNPVVAGRCLVEGGAQAGEVVRRSIATALLARMTDGQQPPVARARAGDALARLGDPRPGVGVLSPPLPAGERPGVRPLPDVLWCYVPPGPFLMGSADDDEMAFDFEKPRHPNDSITEGYLISRYPITNAQFGVFVGVGGYRERRYWTEAGWRWEESERRRAPADYGEPFNLPNHPVVGVTWYEALAFCRWLTERLQVSGFKFQVWRDGQPETLSLEPETLTVRLPSEAEWEKAARGTDGWMFPWGGGADPDRANYVDTGIGATRAVGGFPGGASLYGVEDLSGNVWEWTRSLYRGYPYDPGDGREDLESGDLRVLRGGAFNNVARYVRCAFRRRNLPDLHRRDLGFRLVASPVHL